MKLKKNFLKKHFIPIFIGFAFSICYLLLSIIKHYSFLSGYDLSIIDQAIWKYSHFLNPISTTHVYYDAPIYYDHLELILVLLAPLYWLINSVYVLIILQVASVIASGVAVLLLAKKYLIKDVLANTIFATYLAFFGLQFAIWSDVHTLVFAVGFISWFLYFLECKKTKLTYLFLILAIICKEDIAFLTLLINLTYFIKNKTKTSLISVVISLTYLIFVFFVYFPNFVPGGYHFANPRGLLSDINPYYFIDSLDKQKTYLYSLGWFGFLPLLSFIYLIPFIGDLGHYFVLGHIAIRTEGIFLHYRSTVGLLLVWPTIIAISRFKRLNNWKTAVYLIVCALVLQYYLHLPLSYLTKKYFWTIPPEVNNIYEMLKQVPENESVVTQINIGAHLAHRKELYTLFPSLRDFKTDSPCELSTCRWFRVGGNPKYLLIDTGSTWNSLHYLGSRDDFMNGIINLEKHGNIVLFKQNKTSKLYKVLKKI